MYGYDTPQFNPEPPDVTPASPEPVPFFCGSCHAEDRFMDHTEAIGFGWTRTGLGLICEVCTAEAASTWSGS